MRIIQKLEDQIDEELNDAKKYIECALKVKEEDSTLAELYYTLSNEEIDHMSRLHKQVVRIIEKYKDDKGEPPAAMMAVYNYVHEKNIAKAAEIKTLIAMYKE